jgi:hypothetical protein
MSNFKPEQQWDAYPSAFNTDESDKRELLLQQSVSDDVEFTNPGGSNKNRNMLSEHIKDFHLTGAHNSSSSIYNDQARVISRWRYPAIIAI